MNVESALWILMTWCFSTRALVATVLSTPHVFPTVYGLNIEILREFQLNIIPGCVILTDPSSTENSVKAMVADSPAFCAIK